MLFQVNYTTRAGGSAKENEESANRTLALFAKWTPPAGMEVKSFYARADGKGVDPEYHGVTPALEGIKYNGRWVVIYSKYDLGCALERHQSSDCLGYDPDSAMKIAAAAVLYSLRP